MKQQYDIVIIGGGMVGLACANALAKSKYSIAIIESGDDKIEIPSKEISTRVSAITRASQRFLEKLHVWQDIENQRVSPFREMYVWDSTGNGKIHFDSADVSEANLGYIIENAIIRSALLEKVKSAENIEIFFSQRLKELKDKTLIFEDGKETTAKLFIGADGARSWLRKQAGIEFTERDYGHHALVANVSTEKSHQMTAWQCFMPSGVLAFLPLQDNHQCSIVWSTKPEHAEKLKNLNDTEFNQALSEAFEHRLGKVTVNSKRITFPLNMRHVKDYIKPGIALIGDAAHTIHPLAGQGVNLGFLDAECLAENILNAKTGIDELSTLRKYERTRKSKNSEMILIMDGFRYLFGFDNKPISWIRNFGLNMTNSIDPLKKLIMKKAMGL